MLKTFIKVLSNGENFYSKIVIVLDNIGYNERFKSKKRLVFRLKVTPVFRSFFCFRISIFEAFLLLNFFACYSQNCRVFRSRCNLRLTARNCSFVARISFFSLLFFRRALFYLLKSITRVH